MRVAAIFCVGGLTFLPAAAPASEFVVLAQAGSVGGVVGKQGKAVSGDVENPAPAPSRKRGEAAAPPCGNIAGTWSWTGGLFGKNDTVFSRNGTARHSSGIVGTWTCSGGNVFIDWKNWTKGTVKLSADGKQLINVTDGSVGFTR
jgi:hypothetical protein